MLAYETKNKWNEDTKIVQKPHKNEIHNVEQSKREEFRNSFASKENNWMNAAVDKSQRERNNGGYLSGGLIGYGAKDIMTAKNTLSKFSPIMSNRKGRAVGDEERERERIREVIRTSVAWMPGNLVISPPGIRVNDAHDGAALDDEFLKIPALRERRYIYIVKRII